VRFNIGGELPAPFEELPLPLYLREEGVGGG
jgi:hypothetical protein